MSKTKTIEEKRELEKEVVTWMIKKYCKGNHKAKHGGNVPCEECQQLIDYAIFRSDKCPFIETKTFCNNCRVHCYKPEMRAKIKEVMRYSGPRMLFNHPVMAINHVILSRKEKKAVEKTASKEK
ncbi:nitrous oxide-stimulated promoter family protein [Clostridium sp. Marseille-P299]|uniref:nitrous oxide-stimulated promoter family protein n=1 Tax=Clostridium sp. Marseille-P299 TaxID=1805477 RepID=UPI0008307782|nr:nitrous oxide-stimulated promoter family protein [Clostridium sp. Marseille-P299]